MSIWLHDRHIAEFYECDPAGIVHNSKYFIWFEQARFKIAKEAKIMECMKEEASNNDSYFFPVIEAECKFIRPIPLGTELIIKTQLKKPIVAKFVFKHVVTDAITGIEYARAKTQVSICSDKRGMIMNLSPNLKQVIEKYLSRKE